MNWRHKHDDADIVIAGAATGVFLLFHESDFKTKSIDGVGEN